MKTRKHIYSIDPEIGHERRECDDGTYRAAASLVWLGDGCDLAGPVEDSVEFIDEDIAKLANEE